MSDIKRLKIKADNQNKDYNVLMGILMDDLEYYNVDVKTGGYSGNYYFEVNFGSPRSDIQIKDLEDELGKNAFIINGGKKGSVLRIRKDTSDKATDFVKDELMNILAGLEYHSLDITGVTYKGKPALEVDFVRPVITPQMIELKKELGNTAFTIAGTNSDSSVLYITWRQLSGVFL